MLFFNRSKNAIALSLLIALVPAPAQAAWGFDSLWTTIKSQCSSLSRNLECAGAYLKEHTTIALCMGLSTGVALYFGYKYLKKSTPKRSKPQKSSSTILYADSAKNSQPTPAAQEKSQPNIEIPPMHSMSILPLRQTPSARTQAQTNAQNKSAVTTGAASTARIEPAIVLPETDKLSVAQDGIVAALEKEVNELLAKKGTMEPAEFEKARALCGAKTLSLTLRCKCIHQNLKKRFEIDLQNDLRSTKSKLTYTPGTPLVTIQANINKIDPRNPIRQLFNALFSCEFAQENYDAFLTGHAAVSQLEITDTTIIARLNALRDRLQKAKSEQQAKPSFNVNQLRLRWRMNTGEPAQPQQTQVVQKALPTINENSRVNQLD